MGHLILDLTLGISLELFLDKEEGGIIAARWLWCDFLVGSAEVGAA